MTVGERKIRAVLDAITEAREAHFLVKAGRIEAVALATVEALADQERRIDQLEQNTGAGGGNVQT